MDDEQYIFMVSADITSKIEDNGFPKFDPAILILVGNVILTLVKECYLDNDKIQKPSWLDKIRLKWLIRSQLSWREQRAYGAQINDAILRYGAETDIMTLSRTIARIKGSALEHL